MKILVIVPSLGNGGAEKLASHLAVEYQLLGNCVKIVSFYDNQNYDNYNYLLSFGCDVTFLSKKKGIDLKIFRSLNRIIKSFKPDIINTHLDVLLYMFLCRHNFKTFHTVHSMATLEAKGLQKLIRIISFKIFKVIPVAIGISVQKSISTYYHIHINKIPVIYNGCSFKTKFINRDFYSKLTISVVGSLSKIKNQQLIIKAISSLKTQGIFFDLLILGDGCEMDSLKRLTANLSVEDQVFFMGHINHVEEFLVKSHILVNCSVIEGIPLSIIEGMFYGLPILASRTGGNPDLVINDYNGLLFENDNLESLIYCLKHLYFNRACLELFAKNSFCESSKYTMQACASNYVALFKKELGI